MSDEPLAGQARLVATGDGERLAELFSVSGCPCYCRYHDFTGDHRQWQARMALAASSSQAELTATLGSSTLGFVYEEADQILGWLRYGPPSGNRNAAQRPYQGLSIWNDDRSQNWSIYCFLVAPSVRRRGIARALLDALLKRARAEQIPRVEALPRGAQDVRDEELWTGALALYLDAGFRVVHDFAPYPVVFWEP